MTLHMLSAFQLSQAFLFGMFKGNSKGNQQFWAQPLGGENLSPTLGVSPITVKLQQF